MGGDGGSVPKRKERVSLFHPRKMVDVTDPGEKWKLCPISNYFIRKPVLAGHYGHLMSKEGVLEFLIKLRQGSLGASYIQEDAAPVCDTLHSMKDVKELKLKDNPALDKNNPSEEEWKKGEFVCPITGLETNGKHKFLFSWRCGCVVSERALKECYTEEERASLDKKKCLICEKSYNSWDLVVINPNSKDLKENQAKFLGRKMLPVIKAHGGGLSRPEGIAGESSSEEPSSQEGASSSGAKSKNSDRHGPSGSRSERNSAGPSTSRSRPEGLDRDSSRSKRHHSHASESPTKRKR